MNKAELRRELLEGMCRCAENISTYYDWSRKYGYDFIGVRFDKIECPEAFKPSVADKFMFNHIIDSVIDNIHWEIENSHELEKSGCSVDLNMLTGVNIMAKFYYPFYGTWIKIKNVSS